LFCKCLPTFAAFHLAKIHRDTSKVPINYALIAKKQVN